MRFALLPVAAAATFTHRAVYPDDRPIADVEFAATTVEGVCLGSTITGVLVDSGARTTVLDFEDSMRLGINVAEARYPRRVIGGIVPGAGLPVVGVWIKAFLCDRWVDLPVSFPLGPTHPPLRKVLGRAGAFDLHTVAFQHAGRAVLMAH